MISKGLYEVLSTTICDMDASLRSATTDILNHITTHDPTLLRKYLLTEKPSYTFTRYTTVMPVSLESCAYYSLGCLSIGTLTILRRV